MLAGLPDEQVRIFIRKSLSKVKNAKSCLEEIIIRMSARECKKAAGT